MRKEKIKCTSDGSRAALDSLESNEIPVFVNEKFAQDRF